MRLYDLRHPWDFCCLVQCFPHVRDDTLGHSIISLTLTRNSHVLPFFRLKPKADDLDWLRWLSERHRRSARAARREIL